MKKKILATLALLFALAACVGDALRVPFDKTRWNEKDGHYYFRERMVRDLMKNHLRMGMPHAEAVELLGSGCLHESTEPFEREYEVAVDYVWLNIDPVGGVNLCVEFSADSLVCDFHLSYWGRRAKKRD